MNLLELNTNTQTKETQADIITISQEAGFNSIATFNRVFKEIAGVSPSQYRQEKP